MESTATQFAEKLSTLIKSKMETFHSEILADIEGLVKELEKEKEADVEQAITERDIRDKTDQAKWKQERKNLLFKISKNNKKMQADKHQIGQAMEKAIKDMDRNYQNDKAIWEHEREELLFEKQNWMKEREDLLTERNNLLLKIENANKQIKEDEKQIAEAIEC